MTFFSLNHLPIIVINSTIIYDPHPIQNTHMNMVMGTQNSLSELLLLGTVTFRTKTIGHTTISFKLKSLSQILSFHLGNTICSWIRKPFSEIPKDNIRTNYILIKYIYLHILWYYRHLPFNERIGSLSICSSKTLSSWQEIHLNIFSKYEL
jgi:hypothetical protein